MRTLRMRTLRAGSAVGSPLQGEGPMVRTIDADASCIRIMAPSTDPLNRQMR